MEGGLGGGGTPRYLPPPPRQGTLPPGQVWQGEGVPQGTYPLARSNGERGREYPKVPTSHQGTYPPPARSDWGEGGPRPRYLLPPGQVQWGRGYSKVPTTLTRSNGEGGSTRQGTYPLSPPPQDRTAYGVLDTAAVGTPLAFTQADFLVSFLFVHCKTAQENEARILVTQRLILAHICKSIVCGEPNTFSDYNLIIFASWENVLNVTTMFWDS